jgi:hypothetical protein
VFVQLTVDKMAIASMEKEIEEMELEAQHSRSTLTKLHAKDRALAGAIEAVTNHNSLASLYLEKTVAADSSKRKFDTLIGLLKWQASTVTDDRLSLHYIGSCPSSCVELSFRCHPPTLVASAKHEFYRNHQSARAKNLSVVSGFLNGRMESLCQDVTQQFVRDPQHRLCSAFRSMDWQLSRLENSATEIAMLKRRYKAAVTKCQDSIQLDVAFDKSGAERVRAQFLITEEYPFSPVSIRLDTFVEGDDVDAIHKLLNKSAKIGFGCLSRMCDIIASYCAVQKPT